MGEKMDNASDKIVVQFWGIRGTFPVPGKNALRYGGNTNCVTLHFPDNNLFIFDAGTGIRSLSNDLIKHDMFPLVAKIFISHPHWDHINGIPFFVPLYKKESDIEILGPSQKNDGIEKIVSDQMNGVYFPITEKELPAKITYRCLSEETFYIDEVQIQTVLLSHPGQCLGYRIQCQNKIFCYITDNELYLEGSQYYVQSEFDKLVKFIYQANLLVIDTTYSDEEYLEKIQWGHSCVSRVVDLADKAQVKTLCLYHHDPDQSDQCIDIKLRQAKSMLRLRHSKTRCIAPREGDKIFI